MGEMGEMKGDWGGKRLYELCPYEFKFLKDLNSMAVQASAERGWLAISRFYENCKAKKPGKKGFPRFQKDNRSVEYKTSAAIRLT
jgi:transposase